MTMPQSAVPGPAAPPQSSMMKSAPSLVTFGLSIVLLVVAVVRWPENGWAASLWLAAFLAMWVIRVPASMRVSGNRIVEARRGTSELFVLAAMFVTMMVLPLLYLSFGAFRFADYALPGWAAVAGAVLQVPFLWLFWRSHADLGRNWSPGLEVREGHELVVRGVYARIRHPMYAALWISVLAQPLLLQNWIAGALVVPAFAALWLLRVPQEEAMMRARFGAEYEAYAARTGRIWPS